MWTRVSLITEANISKSLLERMKDNAPHPLWSQVLPISDGAEWPQR
jgi:hypothetical protein